MTDDFFDEQEERSAVKTAIVTKYFAPWARILAGSSQRIGYADLYSGPGRFRDGTESTPIQILKQAIQSPLLRTKLVSFFNDENPEYAEALQREFAQLPGIETMTFRPEVSRKTVDDRLWGSFASRRTIPTLSFIDPWGYKGLSQGLLQALIKDFGCEAIFFFNYRRINAAVENRLVEPHIEALFGAQRLAELRRVLSRTATADREAIILRGLGEVISGLGAPFMIPFRFLDVRGRPSHYICHVTKHQLGYEIMKDVMARLGIADEDGVPQFEYLPPVAGKQLAFEAQRPLAFLPDHLLKTFAGKTLSVHQIFRAHNVGLPFLLRNYRTVLIRLEETRSVSCSPPAAVRRKGTMANHVRVTFPV